MNSLSRRSVLSVATGGLCVASLGSFAKTVQATSNQTLDLIAKANQTSLGQAVRPFERWLYDTGSSGAVIRCRQGDRLIARLHNQLEVPTTVHWHGLRVSKGMDGVSGKFASPLVLPGETFDYQVPLRDPGTHWFHSHYDSLNQIARGLYGPLIVENLDEPVMHEQVMVLDDWTVKGTGPGAFEVDWSKLEPGLAWGHAGVKGRVGETIEVEMLNNSATHHVMHFHGQHVQIKSSSSAEHEVGSFRDSITFEAWSKATIAMKLDRPGLWPLHCHILGHQVSGMFTHYEVT